MELYKLYICIAASVIATIIAIQVGRKKWMQAKADTIKLIDSMMINAEENLGYPPDTASVTYLANHPFLSAKIWEMLGAGGAGVNYYTSKYHDDCGYLDQHFIRNDSFRKTYPCAHAMIQYAVYLCDAPLNKSYGPRYRHPKDEIFPR